jgi:2-oxoisovalerate dehydrogenase E1 component
MILRVPIGAYGSGGPYHLSSIENMPAVPLNSILEQTMIPSTENVKAKIQELLSY